VRQFRSPVHSFSTLASPSDFLVNTRQAGVERGSGPALLAASALYAGSGMRIGAEGNLLAGAACTVMAIINLMALRRSPSARGIR